MFTFLKRKKKVSLIDQAKEDHQHKTKELKKSDHKKNWPFKSDTVTIGRISEFWCIGEANGETFALNGAAEMKFEIMSAHDSGQAIEGKTISRFIEMALNL